MLLSALTLLSPALPHDWPAFRGPAGDGRAAVEAAPLEWGQDANVRWRVPLARPATGSAIVSRGRVFLTMPEDEGGTRRSLRCHDLVDGSELWSRAVTYDEVMPTHRTNPYGGTTPAADGERVVVWHASAGLHCYDFEGELLWSRDLGEFRHMWGYGTSPVIADGRVLLHTGPGAATFLVALDVATGAELWRHEELDHLTADEHERKRLAGSWCTPVVAGEVVVCARPTRILGHDLATGEVLWSCGGLRATRGDLVYSSPVVADGLVYVQGGYVGPSIGVELGGEGEVTETHRAWLHEERFSNVGSGVFLEGLLYVPDTGGFVYCLDPESGEALWKERVARGESWGSITVVGGRMYLTLQSGETVVFTGSREGLVVLARNEVGETTNATPAFSDAGVVLRTHEALWCFGEDAQDDGVVEPPDGFVALFDGATLDGWWGVGTEDPRKWGALGPDALAAKRAESREDIAKHWRAEGGVLVNDGHGLFLTTEEHYGDFELLLDYRTVAGADSGIYLRGVPQVQIWDTTEAGGKWSLGADKGSGGLWNNSKGQPGKDPLVHADRPFGEWNHFRIVMVGEYVTIWLNDHLVVDHARLENYFDRGRPLLSRGPIQLQTHGGEIVWRNVFLRELGGEESNAILRRGGVDEARSAAGFTPIFNGQDLAGWAGPTNNYEVAGGTIVCKPGHGGTIYHDQELADFEVELEIQLPPGGNNGLAIRYPGQGDTAYVGMCELQVLDNTAGKYAKLDPRQYHGSAYGQVAAERGYLRPVGEWNFQRVLVVGSRITVELNGHRILDADLEQASDLMYPKGRFAGRMRTSGFFGLAGHSDPVRFRALRVRPIGQ